MNCTHQNEFYLNWQTLEIKIQNTEATLFFISIIRATLSIKLLKDKIVFNPILSVSGNIPIVPK
jgi:hypothetical protein